MDEPGFRTYGSGVRVLVEEPDYEEGLRLAATLRSAGYDVALCSGPGPEGRRYRACSLVEHAGCAVVDGADVIVFGLGFAGPEQRAVFGRLDSRRGRKSMVVLISPSETGWLPQLGEGCVALLRPVRPEVVAAAVSEALAASPTAPVPA